MQALVIAFLGIVTTFGYLKKVGLLPEAAPFLLELFSMATFVYVIAVGVQTGFRNVRPVYWLVFGAVLCVIACGAVANRVEPGPVVSGLRYYMRAMPFFLLPAVYQFSERQVTTQLKFLGVIALLQLPIAASQRLENLSVGGSTGDTTQGTLLNSAILSIFLSGAIAMLLAFTLRGLIKVRTAILMFFVLVIPTAINETKGTLLILPIGVLVTFLIGATPGARLKSLVLSVVSLIAFIAVFIPVYDHLIETKTYGTSIQDFFTQEGRAEGYLYSGAAVGNTEDVKRADSIVVPLRYLAQDPVMLAFGVGVGNASRSQFGENFVGAHYDTLGPFLGTTFAYVVTEIGILGLFLALLLHWLVFKDARAVASARDGTMSVLALGWCGVVAVMTAAWFYKNLIVYDSISALFWYLSGIIAAERMRRQPGAGELQEVIPVPVSTGSSAAHRQRV